MHSFLVEAHIQIRSRQVAHGSSKFSVTSLLSREIYEVSKKPFRFRVISNLLAQPRELKRALRPGGVFVSASSSIFCSNVTSHGPAPVSWNLIQPALRVSKGALTVDFILLYISCRIFSLTVRSFPVDWENSEFAAY